MAGHNHSGRQWRDRCLAGEKAPHSEGGSAPVQHCPAPGSGERLTQSCLHPEQLRRMCRGSDDVRGGPAETAMELCNVKSYRGVKPCISLTLMINATCTTTH